MTDPIYLTVGELARRVGVTVRTLQYYDQQGLLSPSAKGPQNQRLYTEDNVRDLYRILTLKYLGLSLTEIKSDAALYERAEPLQKLSNSQIDAIEEQFQALFKRMTTLRALHDQAPEGGDISWENMAPHGHGQGRDDGSFDEPRQAVFDHLQRRAIDAP